MRSGDAVTMTPLRLRQSVVTSRTFHAGRWESPDNHFLSLHYNFSVHLRERKATPDKDGEGFCWGMKGKM
jgi:hypothetical protein